MARRRPTNSRRYPRTARLNELFREILAEEFERIDDERLGLFTITAVEVDPGLEWAKVHWSDLGADDDQVLAVLEEHRPRLQRAVNAQTHLRRTPVLSFHADEVARSAGRIEEILAALDDVPAPTEHDGDDTVGPDPDGDDAP